MKALFFALLVGTASARGPHITKQNSSMVVHDRESPTWERHIWVHNPLDKPVWFWIECESQLTSNAIGQQGHHYSEYVFPDIPPGENCIIHHWQIQDGHRPPVWSP